MKSAAALLAAASMLVLAGCSGQAAPEAEEKDSLRIGVSGIVLNLDPAQNFDIAPVAIINLFGGTLTNLNPDGLGVSMGLADTITPGDDKYVVTLKSDLKFSDDTPLTAEDVAASFTRYLADPTNGYGYVLDPIEKVTAIDDLTVEFDLERPYPSLEYALSLPGSIIIPSEVIEERGDELYTIGPLPSSGKYQIETATVDETVLVVNPNYPAPEPEIKKLSFEKVSDPISRLAQVQSGQLDYAEEIAPNQVAQLSGPVEARTAYASNGQTFLAFNNRENSILRDVKVRQAVSAAIDREQINTVAFSGQNRLGLGLFASSSQYNEPFLNENADLDAAKAALRGTECEDGCSLRFVVASDAENFGDVALVVQQNLAEIGIDVVIERVEGAVVAQYATEGNFDIVATGNFEQGDYPAISLQFTLGPTIEALRTGYQSDEMTQVLEELKTADGAALDEKLELVNEIFARDLPLAPLADYMVVAASRVPAEQFSLGPTLFYNVD